MDELRAASAARYLGMRDAAQRRIDQDLMIGRQPAKDDNERVLRYTRLAAVELGGAGTVII